MNTRTAEAWEFWIDVGGTFTDCIACAPDGSRRVHKLLSTGEYAGMLAAGSTREVLLDSARRADPPGFFDGWTARVATDRGAGEARVVAFDAAAGSLRIDPPLPFELRTGDPYVLSCGDEAPLIGMRWLLLSAGRREPVSAAVRLGTTRGTNALLERRGARVALITTSGHGDALEIGDQSRPRLFDLNIRKPRPLCERTVEVSERIDARGEVLLPLDEADALRRLAALRDAGIESAAICLLNSYRNPAHERRIAELAEQAGLRNIVLSCDVQPLGGFLSRAQTTVVDAYLTPTVRAYVARIESGLRSLAGARAASEKAAHAPLASSLHVMSSAGGLVRAAQFGGRDSILSGPAGGVVGHAAVARSAGFSRAIGVDIGGTSTDVSRFDGALERRSELEVEDAATGGRLRIAAPQLAIETVAAGGGSICTFDGQRLRVGPQSAGANPGPACYGRGGPLCVTDVNLLLGRLRPERFPLPLSVANAQRRAEELCEQVASATGRRMTITELAAGLLAIANAHVAGAIRRISTLRGFDPGEYVLTAFGGAGGQHACAIARELGMSRILLPALAGVLSALGIGLADVTRFATLDVSASLEATELVALQGRCAAAIAELRGELAEDAQAGGETEFTTRLDLRYRGQDSPLSSCATGDFCDPSEWRTAFERQHAQLYGFSFPDRPIEIVAARIEARIARASPIEPAATAPAEPPGAPVAARVYADGRWFDTTARRRESLRPGERVVGPALILEATGTILIEPGWSGETLKDGTLLLTRESAPLAPRQAAAPATGDADAADPVKLELYFRRFAEAAEQMGATLQRTALSTNVKQRLDFSCAVFDAAGELIAHAAHIPVHIGAMGACVKHLLAVRGADPFDPDVSHVTNDPFAGGSHLPDITVITPVFLPAGAARPAYFVANRAHHAEIGGLAPGSMSPATRSLAEEGVLLRMLPLRHARREHSPGGTGLDDAALRRALTSAPYPTRDLAQNLADLHAQLAANRRGAERIAEMVGRFGDAETAAYTRHLRAAAERQVRAALRRFPPGELRFADALDDGTPIAVCVRVRGDSAEIDFSGSGPVHPANLNATPAIVASAVLYCIRCLIGDDLPLNGGAFAPLQIILPPGLLNPPADPDPVRCPAVAGGNVETSQRIVDVVLGAFGAAAASQGTMNNVAFGNAAFGYYETLCGGAGAGPGFAGASAVHTHMTNTRLTDPETLEARFPVRLWRMAIRRGSGGAGRWRGGDGVVREMEFLANLELSWLTQRRATAPYGLAGGQPGAAGRNTLLHAKARQPIALPPCGQMALQAGDRLILETPGGGGYGVART